MKRVISTALAFAITISVVLANWPATVQAEEFLLNFVVMSDPHISGSASDNARVMNLVKGLQDTATYLPKISAVLIAGDLTENGYEEQYKGLDYALRFSPTQNLLLTIGNHDAGRDLGGNYKVAYDRYLKYCGKYLKGIDTSVPYYDKWIQGFHFIVLCTERTEWDGAYISDTQLAWFEKKLGEGAVDGKPIFVMCHQALNNTHPRTDDPENQIGPSSDRLKAIIAKYPQVIYMSGHTHNGFGYSPVISEGQGTFVDIPPMRGTTAYGYKSSGVLWYVHVYNDHVTFSARDFEAGKWLPNYDFKIYSKDVLPTPSPSPTPKPTPKPTPLPTPKRTPLPDNPDYALLPESDYFADYTHILGVREKTSAETLLSAFENGAEMTVYGNNGLPLEGKDSVGTGCVVRYRENTEEASERHVIVRGDTDGDGVITSGDYLRIR